ncbi:MAG: glycosyltransferase family 2 protein [Pseudomonadota bacterium]
MPANDPLATEPVTDANFDAQRYLLCCGDLADPYRDGLDPWEHFDRHGRDEGRRQLAGLPSIPPADRSPGVTLCAIARNEGPYLLEWIAWHRLLGIERIVLYSNESDDGSDDLLARLGALGVIDYRPWPGVEGRSSQLAAYQDAIVRCETRWIAFLDLDEFMNLKSDDSVGDFLMRFPPDVGAIGLNWRLFGSAGQASKAPGLVVERFTRAAPRDHGFSRQTKTIAIAADIYKVTAHRVRLMHGRGRYVDAAGAPLDPGRGFAPVNHALIQINHYVLKSREEFESKRARGSALRAVGDPSKFTHRDGRYFEDHDRNEELDESILRRVARLHKEIAALEALLTGPGTGRE